MADKTPSSNLGSGCLIAVLLLGFGIYKVNQLVNEQQAKEQAAQEASDAVRDAEMRPMQLSDLPQQEQDIIQMACSNFEMSGDLAGWRQCMKDQTTKATAGKFVPVHRRRIVLGAP
jgi:uncharacterized protein HemX